MMVCLAIEHVGEFIVRELLYGAGREGIMPGLSALCAIFILNDLKAALRRVRHQAIAERSERIVSQRRG
jgi:hypothetical protein